jgi:hypothetical protein
MTAQNKTKCFWVLIPWGFYKKNQPLEIEVDSGGNPRDSFWSRNLKGLKAKGFVSDKKPNLNKPKPGKKTESPKKSDESKSDKSGNVDKTEA